MRLSYSALNRIVEQKAAEMRAAGKRLSKPGKYVLSQARRLSDEELLTRLQRLGFKMDRQCLSSLVATHCSAEEIAKEFLDRWRPKPGEEEMEGDWCWLALAVLWERWFPDVPNFESLDDAMQKGYELKDTEAGCDLWIEVWADILRFKEKTRCRSMAEFDDLFGGTQSVFNWVQDFEMELGNAAIGHPRFHGARVRFCEEFLREFGGDDELITQNMRRALAESSYAGGNGARSDALYQQWLATDPQWGWGWIGWADLYHFARGIDKKDLARAEAILKQGLSVARVRDEKDIRERLASLYEDQGRHEESREVSRSQASVSNSVERVGEKHLRLTTTLNLGEESLPLDELPKLASRLKASHTAFLSDSGPSKIKVGRNDPCPCGSGKKFKRCCGLSPTR